MADTRPLQEEHFRRLWLANIVTVIGAQLTVVAVPAQIYADTGSSAYVGLTGVFGLVPLIVFGLYGGALADVFDRRTILVVTTVGLIVTSGLFWLQAVPRRRERLAAAQPVRRAAGVLRGQPADPQRGAAQDPAARAAAGGQLAEHDRLPGRGDRRPAGGRRAHPGVRAAVALPDRHGHAVRDPLRGRPAAARSRSSARPTQTPGRQGRGRGVRLPAAPAGAAHVVRGRPDRDDLRHAAGALPRDRARRLRRPGGGRPGVRAAVRRDPRRRGARRRLQRLGVARRGAGSCGDRLHPDLGRGDDRLRRRGRPRGPSPLDRCWWPRC